MAGDKPRYDHDDDNHDNCLGDESESDFDDEYFSRTYRPLSNLPTPPPSSRNSAASQSPRSLLEKDQLLESALLGPATHLVNLIPPTASLAAPSIPTVHELLTRANLPLDTIALAVCILDSLNSKFSLSWRLACPLMRLEVASAPAKRHTIPPTPMMVDQLHIDSVRPELIILSSLIIAVKFLEDCQEPTHYYASRWGKDLWTCEQINVTERCIMESLGYRILPLWDRELIEDALGDMERAGRQLVPQRRTAADHSTGPRRRRADQQQHRRSKTCTGNAMTGLGLQLTPVESPTTTEGLRLPL